MEGKQLSLLDEFHWSRNGRELHRYFLRRGQWSIKGNCLGNIWPDSSYLVEATVEDS